MRLSLRYFSKFQPRPSIVEKFHLIFVYTANMRHRVPSHFNWSLPCGVVIGSLFA